MVKRSKPVKSTKRIKKSNLSTKGVVFDYKNYMALAKFMTDRAKVLGRKRTGITPKQQRQLTTAIKRARHLGLLPFQAHV